MRISDFVTGNLTGLLVGALLAFLVFWPGGSSAVGGVALVTKVTAAMATEQEPDTVVRWRERIVYRDAPVLRRERADSAASPTIEDFCAAAGWSPSVASTTPEGLIPASEPAPSPAPSLALIRSFEQKGGDLKLWTVRTDRALEVQSFEVCPFSFSGVMAGDVARVQTARACWLRDVALGVGGFAFGAGIVTGEPWLLGLGGGSLVLWKVAF